MRAPAAIATIVAAALLAATAGAQAAPLIKITEIGAGTTGDTTTDFLELQMYAPGQTQVGGTEFTLYRNFMAPTSYTIVGDVSNGANQATILIGDTGVAGADRTAAGLPIDTMSGGGGVCYDGAVPPDCVAWGNYFENDPNDPLPPPDQGKFANAFGLGQSLSRSIAPGCPTLLEAGDDTNDNSVDFIVGARSPRSNSTTPTELPCVNPMPSAPASTPATTGARKKKCKKKKKRSAVVAKKKRCKKKKKK